MRASVQTRPVAVDSIWSPVRLGLADSAALVLGLVLMLVSAAFYAVRQRTGRSGS